MSQDIGFIEKAKATTKNMFTRWFQKETSTSEELTLEEKAKQAIIDERKKGKSMHPAILAIKDKKERKGVLDSFENYYNSPQAMAYLHQYANSQFMGYAFLSQLAQDGLISRGVRVLADEMTREWGELVGTQEEDGEEKNLKMGDLESALEDLNVKNVFKEASVCTGLFGGCLVYIDVRPLSGEPLTDEEVQKPLFKDGKDAFNKSKMRGMKIWGLKVIEPINIAPGNFNATDPTAQDYFQPEYYFILGRKIHRSRFLYFADNVPPVLLKPVYMFFGIPLAQLAFPYVMNFYSCKKVCMRIIQKFSLTYFATNIEKLLNGEGGVLARIKTLAKYRDNDGVGVYDKTEEEIGQINTPITGLKEMWYASLELIPMIFGIVTTKMLEISPGGMNSTGEFEMRSFYDSVHTKQVNVFDSPIYYLLKLLCLTLDLNPKAYSWKWKSLYQPTEKERAEINKLKADTDAQLYQMGAIANDDVAKRLQTEKDGYYDDVEIPERIDPRERAELEALNQEAQFGEGIEDE